MDSKLDEITKETLIGDVVENFPKLVDTFYKNGLYCIGCPSTKYETIEQGSMVHGIDPLKVVEDLNINMKRLYQKEPLVSNKD